MEVIELRSLDWEVTPVMENYYTQRFHQLSGRQMEGFQDQEILQGNVSVCVSGNCARDDIPSEESPVVTLAVKDVQIYLHSVNPASAAKAKLVLVDFFSRDTSLFPKVEYSRDMILSLATVPMALSPPDQWDTLAQSLPSVLLRSKESVVQGEGDASRLSRVSSSMQSSDVLPGSLPVNKRQ